jgi:putative transposase
LDTADHQCSGCLTCGLHQRLTKLKQFEDENARLKKIVTDLTLDREMLQDVIRRKL